jgi:hypothetical protein
MRLSPNTTNELTPCSRVLLEKLIVTQLVKKFSSSYGTRMFITVFTAARHLSLSWARCIQSTTSHHISLRCILILSSNLHLSLSSGLFLSYNIYGSDMSYIIKNQGYTSPVGKCDWQIRKVRIPENEQGNFVRNTLYFLSLLHCAHRT